MVQQGAGAHPARGGGDESALNPGGGSVRAASAEVALQAGNGDAALAALRRVERQLERLTRDGEAPQWYVAAGTLANIIERIEEVVLQKR